jgi:hypothetical protein
MRVEAKALERRKREEQRAELAVHNAKVFFFFFSSSPHC